MDKLITSDCGRDFFAGDPFDSARLGGSGFAPVNCAAWRLSGEQPKPYQTVTTDGYDLGDNPLVNFYIKTAKGEKHYITTDPSWPGSEEHAALFSDRPFGLAIPGKFAYPAESVSIFEAYPDFRAWLDGGKATFITDNFVIDKLYQPLQVLVDLFHFTNGNPSVPKLVSRIDFQPMSAPGTFVSTQRGYTTFEYDAFGHIVKEYTKSNSEQFPDIRKTTILFEYGDGTVTITRNGSSTTFNLDAHGRVTGTANGSLSFTYNADNQLVSCYDGRYMYEYNYTWQDGNRYEKRYNDHFDVTDYTYSYYSILNNKGYIDFGCLISDSDSLLQLLGKYGFLGARTKHLIKQVGNENWIIPDDYTLYYDYLMDAQGYITHKFTTVREYMGSRSYLTTESVEETIQYTN